ncbi:Hypothetical protein CpMEX30_1646 [Corynebacterium pseudotuberculosis]|nr:Hypothetical protein CpPAT10_1597 [Corynebacterium pseudotuberculosis PAT10]AEP70830.1 Hypothetical protein Cp4202_1586 [Corynebacterium pseudotuberculosis 42/02-A]AER69613.1 Hypothetical protein Cp106_1556 [Corynebacterium pseudotuberculosis 1/06-A]AFF22748.1 Hypothetical protein CpP54B96_1623 [Corynebacterium pseudotuberculosis P54B96]AFH52544.1 Hypothetical protein Cp267_1659 [Corynebacterium pseudotuberculosis 267]AJC14329.1 Hypothetical protein CpVD57_1627 [Corynebacterium pseudotuberc
MAKDSRKVLGFTVKGYSGLTSQAFWGCLGCFTGFLLLRYSSAVVGESRLKLHFRG